MPSLVSGEGGEVLGLELGDEVDGDAGLFSESLRLPSIVRTVSKFLAHKPVSVMSIVWSLSEMLVTCQFARPPKVRPHNPSHCCMRVSRLTGVEISVVVEEVPLDGSDAEGLAGLGVEFSKFITLVRYKDTSETFFNVLEISSRPKFR